MSSFERRPFSLVMVIDSDLPLWMTIEHRLTMMMTDDLRSLVRSRYLHDTVRVDLESNFNLRDATGCWWDSGQLEFSEEIVVLR